jgi:hypothetical protein
VIHTGNSKARYILRLLCYIHDSLLAEVARQSMCVRHGSFEEGFGAEYINHSVIVRPVTTHDPET